MSEQNKSQVNEVIKSHFEANMLDGQLINDCGGAMLSAESVLEYLIDYASDKDTQHKAILKEVVDELNKVEKLDHHCKCEGEHFISIKRGDYDECQQSIREKYGL